MPLEEHALCLLVMIGLQTDGPKEPVALTDGAPELTEPGPICCGITPAGGTRAPVLARAMARGFWIRGTLNARK
jgi:hypothetical protein